MEADESFIREINSKLHGFCQDLENNYLPSLKAELRNFQTMMETVMKVLLKKGIIILNPYKYEEKFIDVTPVSTESFSEAERLNEMSVRLSQFMDKLDFLNNYFQFTVDAIDFLKLKNLAAFIRFISWDNLSPNHQEAVQRAMQAFIVRAQSVDDPLTSGLIKDATNQLALIQKKILEIIKRVGFYKREEYKNLLRSTLGRTLSETAQLYFSSPESALVQFRKEFSTHLKGQPFILELIKELFAESFGPQCEALRKDLCQKLTIKTEKKNPIHKRQDFKPLLFETLRQLANAGPPLEAAMKKLADNSAVLEDRRKSFGEHLGLWFKNLFGQNREPLIYLVEMFDPQTAVVRPERIDFDKFQKDGSAKVKILGSLGIKTSPSYIQLTGRPEPEILDFVNTQFLETSRLVERISALDVYFKAEVPKEKKKLISGTKLEVMQVRTYLTATNKAKLEYVAAAEEIELLRRLGVQPQD